MEEQLNEKVEKPRIPKKFVYMLLISYVSAFIAAGISIQYANYVSNSVNAKSDHRWCELLTTLDDAYTVNRPTSPVLQKVAEEVHSLRVGLEC